MALNWGFLIAEICGNQISAYKSSTLTSSLDPRTLKIYLREDRDADKVE